MLMFFSAHRTATSHSIYVSRLLVLFKHVVVKQMQEKLAPSSDPSVGKKKYQKAGSLSDRTEFEKRKCNHNTEDYNIFSAFQMLYPALRHPCIV